MQSASANPEVEYENVDAGPETVADAYCSYEVVPIPLAVNAYPTVGIVENQVP